MVTSHSGLGRTGRLLAAELNDHETAAIADDGSAELSADVLMTAVSARSGAT